jgi:peptidoglycan/LPS O-acetylase OafA/YrhL
MVASQREIVSDEAADAASVRRQDIQGLRGVAVLLVVAFHAALRFPGGYVGVDVFFVISGFVITNLLLRELSATDGLRFWNFYVRRIRRLLPALALVIIAVCVSGVFLLSPLGTQEQSGMLARAAATFRANLSLYNTKAGYFDLGTDSNPLLHMWSLGVEEQFYLLFPAFLLAVWSWGTRLFPSASRRGATGVLIAFVAAGSLWLSYDLTAGHSFGSVIARPSLFAFYGLPTRAWEFAVGALVAVGVPYLRQQRKQVAAVIGVVGLVLIVGSARLMTIFTPFPGTAALLPVGGAGLVVAAGTIANGGASRLLAIRPLVWFGDLSYSWYLWHWPLIVFAGALWPTHGPWLLPLAAAVSLVPAWCSYRFVEQPFRQGVSWTRHHALAIAAVCIAGPIAISLLAPYASRQIATQSTVAAFQYQLRPHAMSRCNSVQPEPRPACTVRPLGKSRGEVWLIGDSQAGMFAEPAAAAARANRYTLVALVSPQCPFIDVMSTVRGTGPATTCRQFVRTTVDNLAARKPTFVIIASEFADYINSPAILFTDPRTGKSTHDASRKTQLLREGLQSILTRFHDASIPTLVVNTIPHFGAWDPRTCPAAVIAHGPSACGTTRSRTRIDADERAALEGERAATALTHANVVDFSDDLCDAKRCVTNNGNFFIYKDGRHLSVDGALTLTNRFDQLIAQYAQPSTS